MGSDVGYCSGDEKCGWENLEIIKRFSISLLRRVDITGNK